MDAPVSHVPRRIGVWALAWPAVLTNLLQSTVGLVDVKVVGSLGATAVAAANSGHRVLFVVQSVLMAVSAGSTALVARAWGAAEREEAAQVVDSSLILGASAAIVMGIVCFATAQPFAALCGLSGDARGLAALYIRWVSVFALPFALGFVLVAGLRATGDMRTPLFIGAITNIVNILLLYLLVYGGLGAPKLGIAGAAIAGGIAYTVGAAIVVTLYRRARLPIRPSVGRRSSAHVRALVRVGYPAALEQLVVQAGFITFISIIARCYGVKALAAYGIGVQILSLSFVVGFGFSIAAATIVGQRLGAGDPEGAFHSGWRAMALAVGSMSLLSVLITWLAHPIARLMIADPEVVRLTVAFIYFLGAAQPLMAIDFALGGALRGAGDTRFPLFTTFTGLIVGRVLLASVFTHFDLPVEWIYGSLLADYVLKSSLLVGRFRSRRWQHAMTPREPAAVAASEPPLSAT